MIFRRASPRLVLATCVVPCILALWLLAFVTTLSDDAYITLQFARNLATGGGWGFFPGETINTATSPLNVGLLALALLVFKSPVAAVGCYSAILWAGISGCLWRIGQVSASRGVFFTASALGLFFNPLLLSNFGLESWLLVFLVLLSAALLVSGKCHWLAVALALATLARIDSVLFSLLCLALVPGRRAKFQTALLYVLLLLPWYLFSWVALGSLLPETLFIKASQKSWDGYNYFSGLAMYFKQYPLQTTLSCAYLIGYCGLARIRKSPAARVALLFVAYAALHFIAYTALRVPPYHWYYTPQVLTLVVVGSLGLARLTARAEPSLQRVLCAALAIPPIVLAGSLIVRQGLPLEKTPIFTNWATAAEYREIGQWLRDNVPPDQEIEVASEIGTLAYYSRRRLRDPFSDRGLLLELIHDVIKPRGLRAMVVRLNYLFLDPLPSPPRMRHALAFFSRNEPLPTHVIRSWRVMHPGLRDGWFVYSEKES